MKYLSVEQILLIHSIVIDESGGAHGLRDRELLLSVVALPQQTFDGRELYGTIFKKAAAYARTLIASHPFIDGNKRTGMTAASVFLELNGYRAVTQRGEIEKMALRIVRRRPGIEVIAAWFKKHSKRIKG